VKATLFCVAVLIGGPSAVAQSAPQASPVRPNFQSRPRRVTKPKRDRRIGSVPTIRLWFMRWTFRN
jgi:hypothetical protein